MLRILFGVIAGFIGWSILWLGSDQVLSMLSPAWYGAHQTAFQLSMETGQPYAADSMILVINLVRAAIISVISGLLAALCSGETRRAPLFLGIVLVIVGVLFEAAVWSMLPIWYHVIFIILLLPATLLGGRLKPSA